MWQPGFSPTLDDLFRGRLARVYHSAIWAVSHWAISPLLSRIFLHLEENNLRKSSFAPKMAIYEAIFGQCFGLRIWTTRVRSRGLPRFLLRPKKTTWTKKRKKNARNEAKLILLPRKDEASAILHRKLHFLFRGIRTNQRSQRPIDKW